MLLLQEIAARSAHFFEAAGVVQDLRMVLTRTFQQVAELRKEVRARLSSTHAAALLPTQPMCFATQAMTLCVRHGDNEHACPAFSKQAHAS